MKNVFKKAIILLCCMLVFGAYGCSKKSESTASKSGGSADYSMAENKPSMSNSAAVKSPAPNSGVEKTNGTEAAPNEVKSENTNAGAEQRKVIKTSKLEVETKHFDDAVNFVIERTDRDKGYIQSSNIQGGRLQEDQYAANRYAQFTIRIPVDKLNSFLKDAEAIGVITSRSDNDEDVTSQYFDTEARVKTLKIQEDRLLSILQKSEKLTDIIELEKRLSEVRNEIESLTGTLKKYDNLVALATVNVNIREVQTESPVKVKPVTFGDKILDGFKQSVSTLYEIIKGIILAVVYVLPFAVAAVIIYIPVRILVKRYNRSKSDKENKEDTEDMENKDDENTEK